MKTKNIKMLFLAVLIAFLLVLLLLFFGDTLLQVNVVGREMRCKKTLKAIANAIQSYQAEYNGAFPPSLLELCPYFEGEYQRGPNDVPKCPGNRNEAETSDSWTYIYRAPLSNDVVKPVCWDRKPHKAIKSTFRDEGRRNIIFSDWHIERIKEKKFLQFMQKYNIEQPNKDRVPDTLNSGDY